MKTQNVIAAIILAMVIILGIVAICCAQTWQPTNQVTVGWDAVTAASGTITYKVYSKPEIGGIPALMTTVSATQATVTFTQEGRYYLGVSTVRTVGGVAYESPTTSWSNVVADTFQGQTFGVEYIIPSPSPKNIRSVN
jgi:hypothetical protein